MVVFLFLLARNCVSGECSVSLRRGLSGLFIISTAAAPSQVSSSDTTPSAPSDPSHCPHTTHHFHKKHLIL